MTRKSNRESQEVDKYIADRLRTRRRLLNITQEEMARSIGVTFQQVQKYESGNNRISASRLHRMCAALSCAPSYFFEGLEYPEAVNDPGRSNDALEIVRMYLKLADSQRGAVRTLLLEMGRAA